MLTSLSRRRPLVNRRALLILTALVHATCGSKSPMSPTPPGSTLKVTSILPAVGSTTGATSVMISGAEFGSDATVTIGGVAATNIVLQGATALTATVGPRPAPGASDVVVTSAGRTATLPNGFTFVAPSGANQPPAITNIRSVGSRNGQPSGFGDQDETVTLVATVTDAETPSSALTYEWTGPGTFAGSGTNIAWRLPTGFPTTPSPATATLKVTETFVEGSVTHTNVSSASFVMQVHDSQKEIMDMGEDFLTLFSRSEVSTNDVLHNFSATCDGGRGRGDETGDVDQNRALYVQDFSKFRIRRLPPVTFNFGGRCPFRLRAADACSAYEVHWEVTKRSNGSKEITDGVDFVTAVLENNRWRLCHSDFEGMSTNLTTGITSFVQW